MLVAAYQQNARCWRIPIAICLTCRTLLAPGDFDLFTIAIAGFWRLAMLAALRMMGIDGDELVLEADGNRALNCSFYGPVVRSGDRLRRYSCRQRHMVASDAHCWPHLRHCPAVADIGLTTLTMISPAGSPVRRSARGERWIAIRWRALYIFVATAFVC